MEILICVSASTWWFYNKKSVHYNIFVSIKCLDILSSGERISIIQALTFLESKLDEPKLEHFKQHYEEGYNVHVDDDSGKLWQM